jgi:hypothetical protein
VGLHRPSKTFGPQADRSLAEAALAQPGAVLFKEVEQASDGTVEVVQQRQD